ncbi:MAG: VOC family protein [Pseudomonadota bacterium]
MPVLEGIAPIVPVSDMAAAIAFYRDILGFDVRTETEDGSFALVARDQAGVSLVKTVDEDVLKATRDNISAYVWTEDLSGLWTELKPALSQLDTGRVRAPFTQAYGMREFHVNDPDGFLILLGEDADQTGDA